jgi:hypothetical protein
MAHKVRTHKWLEGFLQWEDHLFESAAEAIGFAHSHDSHVRKVYDDNDLLIHEVGQAPAEVTATYA